MTVASARFSYLYSFMLLKLAHFWYLQILKAIICPAILTSILFILAIIPTFTFETDNMRGVLFSESVFQWLIFIGIFRKSFHKSTKFHISLFFCHYLWIPARKSKWCFLNHKFNNFVKLQFWTFCYLKIFYVIWIIRIILRCFIFLSDPFKHGEKSHYHRLFCLWTSKLSVYASPAQIRRNPDFGLVVHIKENVLARDFKRAKFSKQELKSFQTVNEQIESPLRAHWELQRHLVSGVLGKKRDMVTWVTHVFARKIFEIICWNYFISIHSPENEYFFFILDLSLAR